MCLPLGVETRMRDVAFAKKEEMIAGLLWKGARHLMLYMWRRAFVKGGRGLWFPREVCWINLRFWLQADLGLSVCLYGRSSRRRSCNSIYGFGKWKDSIMKANLGKALVNTLVMG